MVAAMTASGYTNYSAGGGLGLGFNSDNPYD